MTKMQVNENTDNNMRKRKYPLHTKPSCKHINQNDALATKTKRKTNMNKNKEILNEVPLLENNAEQAEAQVVEEVVEGLYEFDLALSRGFVKSKLIMEHRFLLNTNIWIHIGFDPTDNLETIIRIYNSRIDKFVDFKRLDWYEFLRCYNIIIGFLRVLSVVESYSISNHKLLFDVIENDKIMIIESQNNQIYLSDTSIRNIFKNTNHLDDIINYLESLNFLDYYLSVMRQASSCDGDIYTNIKNIIGETNNVYNLAMKEIILNYNNVILASIEIITTSKNNRLNNQNNE